jgi:hypothetical protein
MECEQRLAAAYALAEISLEEAFGERRAEWINRLEAEHDNLNSLLQELRASSTQRSIIFRPVPCQQTPLGAGPAC